jgi:c-di-GMP-binding flagellar brake protein YcgR
MSPNAKKQRPAPAFIETDDRRTAQRKSMRLRAAIRVPGRPTLHTGTLDISTGGVCVEMPHVADLASVCEIDINLDACGTTHLIRLYGRVCYSVEVGERAYRTGMQFVRMRDEVAAQLAALLK